MLLRILGRGEREVDVARDLGVSRQAVSKALRKARARLSEIFIRLSEVLNSDIIRINISRGYMILRNRQINQKIYVIYVPGEGPLTLFGDEIDCSGLHRRFCEKIVYAIKYWGLVDWREEYRSLEEIIRKAVSEIEK